MKLTVIVSAMILSVAMLAAPAALAQPAPQPAPAQKAAPQKASKATPAAPVQGSYKTEAEAQKQCTGAAVVWVNTRSKVYHAKGARDYGKTKEGFYMCQAQADKSGFRAVRASRPKAKSKSDEKSKS